jgi:4-hydroxybenzoate polyprenyltransferase
MKIQKFTHFIKLDQLILCLSLVYLGLLFAGRAEYYTWLLATAAVISAKIVHISFRKLQDDYRNNKSPRFRERLLPEGDKKKLRLWISGVFFSAIFIFSSFIINELCYYISIASVLLMIVFPFIRRFTPLPYCYLGLFETICPVAGFIAANNRFEMIALIPAGAVFFWALALEISLAIYEMDFDTEKKIFSIPRAVGINKAQIISIILYLFSITAFITAGISNKMGLAYWISLFCFFIIFIRQEFLLKARDAVTAKSEFLQINIFIGPIIFLGTVIDIFYK